MGRKHTKSEVTMDHCSPSRSETSFALKHPFSCIIAGPSQSGKSTWLSKVLKSDLIQPPPSRIVWFYTEWQGLYKRLQEDISNIYFVKGMPQDLDKYMKSGTMLIFDDMQSELNDEVTLLFTKYGHHRGVSCFLLLQNALLQSKNNRTCSINAHYICLMKNPRDVFQVQVLSRQIMGNKAGDFMKIYSQATAKPHGYLLVDLKQDTDEKDKLKTDILPGEYEANDPFAVQNIHPQDTEGKDY